MDRVSQKQKERISRRNVYEPISGLTKKNRKKNFRLEPKKGSNGTSTMKMSPKIYMSTIKGQKVWPRIR